MKQIKPTIIYNEAQWTPIVPLNYKTQITNPQWAGLAINPPAEQPESNKDGKERTEAEPSRPVLRSLSCSFQRGSVEGLNSSTCSGPAQPLWVSRPLRPHCTPNISRLIHSSIHVPGRGNPSYTLTKKNRSSTKVFK